MGIRVISTAVDSTGARQPYIYLSALNTGFVSASFTPFAYDIEVYDNPVVLSPDRTLARRWRYEQGGFVSEALDPQYGTCDHVMMTSPNGTQYVYTVDNNGDWQYGLFTAAGLDLTMTIMHKGSLVFVADNRQNTPRRGDV